MPQYGKLKIDQFLYNDSGTDVTLDLANLASKGANTFTGHQSHGDNIEARFGTDNDLLILHNNSSGFIWNTTGDTLLRGSGNGWINIQPKSGEAGIVVKPDNATELYYDNVKKFETTSSGATVTGQLAIGTVARIESTGEYKAPHGSAATPSFNFLSDNDNGMYRITTNTIGFSTGGTEALRLDGSQNALFAGDIDLADSKKIKLGNGDDLQIWHNGSANLINAVSHDLELRHGGENMAKFHPDGEVELYYDGSKKFETTSGGISVTGNVAASNDLEIPNDSGKIKLGTGSDLQIYHDGSNSYIDNHVGVLNLRGDGDNIHLQPVDGEHALIAKPNGAVELYYDSSKKFETTSAGNNFTGKLSCLDGSGSAGSWISMGDSDDFQIFHNTHNHIRNNVANQNIYIEGVDNEGGTPFIYLNPRRNQTGLSVKANQGVDLYYDDSKKLETTSGGVNVTGALTVNGSALAGGGYASVQVFTSSGTWTKPSGIKLVRVIVTGGGGAGKGNYGNNSAGGGGGGTAIKTIDVSSISSETVTIGAGGASSQDGGVAAPSGSASSFGSHCSGGGGGGGNNWTAGGAGGSGSSGDVNIKGTMGHGYWQGLNQVNGGGGGTIWGSPVNHANAVTNYNGDIYGVGGSGGSRGSQNYWPGGAGYQGIVIVYEYK